MTDHHAVSGFVGKARNELGGVDVAVNLRGYRAERKLLDETITRGLAREFGEFNITANCMGPGAIERAPDPTVVEKPLRSAQPIPRKGKPEEAVSLLLYLASVGAWFITGQCYLVNGGTYFQ